MYIFNYLLYKIIFFQGGTGFSSTNAYLEGFDKRPMLQA